MKKLDVDEYFYLALNAIEQNNHESAILSLKNIGPGEYYNRAQYLLAAEYAQIGMYDRALEGFATVIEAEPSMTIVSIQKALLHLVLNDLKAAELCLLNLVSDENDPIFWFAKGLIAVTQQEPKSAIELLTKGISLNTVNAPLNTDMQQVIDQLIAAENLTESTVHELAEPLIVPSTAIANKFLLTNYKNDEV